MKPAGDNVALKRGDHFLQMGVTLEILEVVRRRVIYRCRCGKSIGPPRVCSIEAFEEHITNGTLKRIEGEEV